MLQFHRSIIFIDNCFSFMNTLADTLCSMDVSRSPDSLTSYPHFMYHVPPARILVRSRSHLTCSPLLDTRTVMDCRLVSGYLFVFHFPFRVVDSYTYDYSLTSFSVCLVDLSPLTVTAYAFSFCSSSTHLPSRYFWTLTCHRVISLSCIFVLVSRVQLYIQVGDVGLFPIFNLLCNHPKGVTCEIPRTLLVLSSSLAKATALRP